MKNEKLYNRVSRIVSDYRMLRVKTAHDREVANIEIKIMLQDTLGTCCEPCCRRDFIDCFDSNGLWFNVTRDGVEHTTLLLVGGDKTK